MTLELRNVSKRVAGDDWIYPIDLVLESGRFNMLLGTTLAGKTTLMHLMAGLEKPDEGEIVRACRISFPLGFMGGVLPLLSATENSRYIAQLYGLDPDYVEAFCRWVCDLEEYFDRPLGTYSAGMKARFQFSLLLALEFDIYLIDEGMPRTTDANFNRKAGTILAERLKSATVIIVSHQADTLEKFARRAAVLKDGQFYQFDSLEEAKRLYDYETQG